MTPKVKGTIAGIASAVSYGLNSLGALPLYEEGYSTSSVLFYRFFFAFLFLGVLFSLSLFTRRGYPKRRLVKHVFAIRGREALILLVCGLLFGSSALALFESFHHMSAGIACALVFLYPILTAVLMAVLFRERLHAPTILAIFVALGGIWYLSNSEGSITLTGGLLVGWSALSYALYIIIVNKARLRMATGKMTFYLLIGCTLSVVLCAALSADHNILLPYTARGWFFGWMLAMFPTVLSLFLMIIAVRNIGGTSTAVLGAIDPLTAVTIGVLLFGEPFTLRIGAGVGLILTAVMLMINEPYLLNGWHYVKQRGMRELAAMAWRNRWYVKHKYYDPRFKRNVNL